MIGAIRNSIPHIPFGVDALVAEYVTISEPQQQAIEASLREWLGNPADDMRPLGPFVEQLSLDGVDLNAGVFQESIQRFKAIFPNLKRLSLVGAILNQDILVVLNRHFPDLEELDVSRVEQDLFAHFPENEAAFAKLRVLRWNDAIKNAHWCTHLPRMPELRHLSIQAVAVTQPTIIADLSRKCPMLEKLDLSRSSYDIDMHRLQHLEKFRHLRELNIEGCSLIPAPDRETLRALFPVP